VRKRRCEASGTKIAFGTLLSKYRRASREMSPTLRASTQSRSQGRWIGLTEVNRCTIVIQSKRKRLLRLGQKARSQVGVLKCHPTQRVYSRRKGGA
jgi:hypothetical protein